MLALILTILTLSVLTVASYVDFRTREVPDWLSYAFVAAAIGIRAIFSVEQGGLLLGEGVAGAVIFLSVGYLFYRTRQWGGGDTKLFMGLGAVIGIPFSFTLASLKPFWYFILLFLAGAIYGLLYLGLVALRHHKVVGKELRETLQAWKTLQGGVWIAAGFFLLLGFASLYFLPLAVLPPLLFYLFLSLDVIEKSCFVRWIAPQQATEGDWLAKPVFSKGKVLMARKTLDKDDILFLETRTKRIAVKDGIPFVPSFLLAFAAYLLTPPFVGIIL